MLFFLSVLGCFRLITYSIWIYFQKPKNVKTVSQILLVVCLAKHFWGASLISIVNTSTSRKIDVPFIKYTVSILEGVGPPNEVELSFFGQQTQIRLPVAPITPPLRPLINFLNAIWNMRSIIIYVTSLSMKIVWDKLIITIVVIKITHSWILLLVKEIQRVQSSTELISQLYHPCSNSSPDSEPIERDFIDPFKMTI